MDYISTRECIKPFAKVPSKYILSRMHMGAHAYVKTWNNEIPTKYRNTNMDEILKLLSNIP